MHLKSITPMMFGLLLSGLSGTSSAAMIRADDIGDKYESKAQFSHSNLSKKDARQRKHGKSSKSYDIEQSSGRHHDEQDEYSSMDFNFSISGSGSHDDEDEHENEKENDEYEHEYASGLDDEWQGQKFDDDDYGHYDDDDHHLPAVPVPAAVWLFASGLIGLVAVGRRRNT